MEWIGSTGCVWISVPRAGLAIGFLAGMNGDVQQQRLVIAPEEHTATVHVLELVLSVCPK